MELFDFHDPRASLEALRKLDELGYASYEHSHQIAARAHASIAAVHANRGDFKTAIAENLAALREFEAEEKCFPFSAINAGLELSVLRLVCADPQLLGARMQRFEELMKMRKLEIGDFPRLLRNPAMDDTPLPWRDMALRGAEERRRR